MQLVKVKTEDFNEVYARIEESFPICERRSFTEAKEVLKEKEYTLFHIEDKDKRIGFISVWNLDGFWFIEHFAIYPEFRNCGFGSRVLDFAKDEFKTLVLEAEPNVTEIAKRRLDFYKRNGFCQNPFKYMQPAYREGEDDVELVLLSFPNTLTDGERIVKEIYKKVYGR